MQVRIFAGSVAAIALTCLVGCGESSSVVQTGAAATGSAAAASSAAGPASPSPPSAAAPSAAAAVWGGAERVLACLHCAP